jgi:hypothetical protein
MVPFPFYIYFIIRLFLYLKLIVDDEVMKLADMVVSQLYNGGPNERSETMQNIMSLASHLKLYGQQLEGIYGGMYIV